MGRISTVLPASAEGNGLDAKLRGARDSRPPLSFHGCLALGSDGYSTSMNTVLLSVEDKR